MVHMPRRRKLHTEAVNIERKADRLGYSAEERLELRQKESRAVLDEFYGWVEQT